MTINKETKKNIIDDWQNAFPQLSIYAQNKLYKVVGPVIIGLELMKLPNTEEYRPHLIIYPLWKKNVKISLDYPILLKEFQNKKGLQYNIPYIEHERFFNDVSNSVKKQNPLSFNGNISFKKLISILDEYSKTPPLSAAPNSYLQALVQEAKFKIALFMGIIEAQSVLEQINNRNWDVNHFKACNINIDEWLKNLETALFNRDEFIKQIEINKEDKKIQKLESSEIIG